MVSHANVSSHLENVKHKEEISQKISQSEPEKHPSTDSTQPGNPTTSSSKSASSSTRSTPNPNDIRLKIYD